MSGLTDRQKRFVEEYVIDGNAMQAAIRAGYAKSYAKANSYKLLDNVGISDAIALEQDKREKQLRQRFAIDAEEARKIMFQLMKSDDTPENVRLSAAKDFLDRAGFKPVEKQETMLNGDLSIADKADVIEKYLKRGKK